jgi:ribosomal protein S6--L-glutamate ligase
LPENDDRPLLLGLAEWVALPDLGLPAIRAKVDTGAKTSALGARDIERFAGPDGPMVRFTVHPVPGRPDIAVPCTAPLVDRRAVASSNGGRQVRPVIQTTLALGGRAWPIEVTLANREGLSYRMLLGRQALPKGTLVDPSSVRRQPRLSYSAYRRPKG